MKKCLMVCLGNICRSPTAHGILAHEIERQKLPLFVDSAGTAAYHIGKAPDSRSQATAKEHGYDLSDLRARQVVIDDFYEYDYIFAMDNSNLANLKAMQPKDASAKLSLYLEFANLEQQEVPDPYYGDGDGFEIVLDLCERATQQIIDRLT
ncbi:low molecular weight phosphotyrosine protein phosphatase [Reinekea forsetii]|nr:low molecular weight phosphotyrosine protein phosphatase [Reinekea forsetii]